MGTGPGSRGNRLSAAKKVERDTELIKDRARGMTWKRVGEKHGVSEQQARKIWAAHRDTKMPALQGQDAIDVVFEILERYEAWQGELAEISAKSKGTIRIGAIRAQMDCETRKADIMQATGMLPKHLGKIAIDFDARFVTTRVLAIFDQYGLPPDAQKALLDVLQRSS